MGLQEIKDEGLTSCEEELVRSITRTRTSCSIYIFRDICGLEFCKTSEEVDIFFKTCPEGKG